MKDWQAHQARYQRDSAVVQLGGLASNLSRIAWFAQRQDLQLALPVFRESKCFTEWAASACSLEQQGELAELQLQLALWQRGWGERLSTSRIAEEARRWSTRLLTSAGLSSQ
jgi:hypothetical protein